MERGVLTGIGLLRAVAFVWMVVVLVVQEDDLRIAWLAWALVGLAGVVTVWLTVLRTRRPESLLEPAAVLVEVAVALALVACDGVVFVHGHIGSDQSSLEAAWPLASVLSAGVAFGEGAGLAAGLGIGAAHFASAPLNGASLGSLRSPTLVSFFSTLVLYALAGVVAGYAVRLVRQADDEVARARAREDVSRALHDGVLQTLALVERRATDPQLAGLAREQERELRGFLAGYGASPPAVTAEPGRLRSRRRPAAAAGQLEEGLRRAAGRFETTYGGRVDVVVAPDVPALDAAVVEALTGAVAEALVNAGKHGHATRVTVYVEPAEAGRVFCSVKDDGEGFEAGVTPEGMGLRGSVRGRVEGLGGRVVIDAVPGGGAEVMLWL